MSYNNIAYIYAPKNKDPFTGEWNNKYLVPALESQQGTKNNYVVVTCSPQHNGLYSYPAENISKYQKWKNGSKTCLYVPREDCTYKKLEAITQEDIREEIKKQQNRWYNNQVKGRDYTYKKEKPEWMLK